MCPRTLRRTQNAGATEERVDTIGMVPGKRGPHVGNKLDGCCSAPPPPILSIQYESKSKASRDDVGLLLVLRKRNRD